MAFDDPMHDMLLRDKFFSMMSKNGVSYAEEKELGEPARHAPLDDGKLLLSFPVGILTLCICVLTQSLDKYEHAERIKDDNKNCKLNIALRMTALNI